MHTPSVIDIARHARVGKSTAARALSGVGAVSAAARKRIQAAAESLHYRPHAAARALRTGENRLLGVVVPTEASRGMLSHAIQAQKMDGLAHGAKRLGYDLQIFLEDIQDPAALRRLALEKSVAGFFFLRQVPGPTLEFLRSYRIPWIGINWRRPEHPGDPHCWTDFAHAGRALTGHLIEAGCRRLLAFDWLSCEYGPFEGGIREAWALYRLSTGHLTIHSGLEYAHGPAVDEALARALKSPERPDAVLVSHEAAALSAYRLLRTHKLRVGRDVAVATFDDLEIARHLEPPCTAYAQPAFEMGEAGVEELDRLLRSGKQPRVARTLPGTLRARASSRLT